MNQFSFDRPFSYPDGVSIDAMYGPWDNVSGLVTMVQNDFGFDAPKDGTEFAIKSANGVKVYVWDSKVTPDANGYTYKEIGGGASAEQLAAKQDKLSEEQLLSVNSGITKPKISTYDGYATSIGDLNREMNNKQPKLNESQMAAVNSGATSTKVNTYDTHVASTSNPHSVTKAQVGLGSVDNTSDADKPISTATQTALNGKQTSLNNSQLSAVNSGITQTKVSQYDGYASQMSAMQIAVDSAVSSAGSASTSARDAEQSANVSKTYLYDLKVAIQDLPDGQAVSAQVAENTASINALETKTESIIASTSECGNEIVFTTDNNEEVAKITDEGVSVSSLKINGENILNKISVLDKISEQGSSSNNEIAITTDDGEEIFVVNNDGVKVKKLSYIGSGSLSLGSFHTMVRKPMTFAGKSAVFLGDSITYGYVDSTTDVHTSGGSYPSIVSEALGMTPTNLGQNGATIASVAGLSQIIQQAQNASKSADFLFVAAGVNDCQKGVALSTFRTALESLINFINLNFPSSTNVIFITPINEDYYNKSERIESLQKYRDIISKVVILNDTYQRFSLIQGGDFVFPTVGGDEELFSELFADRLHPSVKGYKVYSAELLNLLN